MAGNKITLTMAGDSSDLERAFEKAGAAATSMSDDVDKAGTNMRSASDSFDAVGDSAGELDTRAMGFRDTITGVQDTMGGWSQLMQGDVQGGLLTLGMGVGDLASGVENLIVPIVKSGTTWVATHASMAASSIASAATAVASWVSMAAASVVNAATVAASWLLAFAPVIIVVAIVVGLVILIIKNWDTIKRVISAGWEFVKRNTSAAWNWIKSTVSSIISGAVSTIRSKVDMVKSIFRSLVSGIRSIMSGLASAITAPFRVGFSAIRGIWNNTVGGKGFSVPSWVPGVGGKEFRIPKLAEGGIVTGPTLALVGEGSQSEAVIPLDRLGRMMNGNRTVIELRSGGSRLDDAVLEILRQALHSRGLRVLG